MPWTLYRYILREMLKLLVAATAVLLCMMSFAAAIKPSTEGLLDAAGLVKFVLFTAPTFLQFVLPFAAAFAGTMVFHRMTTDNEIIACCGSGMSYRSILAPVLFLGLCLMVGLIVLSNWIVPPFYQKIEALLQKDAISLLVNKVRNGETFTEFEGYVLYADDAVEAQLPEYLLNREPAPHKLIILGGVAVTQEDPEGRLVFEGYAEQADALVYLIDGQTLIDLHLQRVTYHNAANGTFQQSAEPMRVGPIRIPSPFKDDLKFFSWARLAALKHDPDTYDLVKQRKRELAAAMATARAMWMMQRRLSSDGPGSVVLAGPLEGERIIVYAADAVLDQNGQRLVLSGSAQRPLHVEYLVRGEPRRQFVAKRATISVETREVSPEPEVHVQLFNLHVRDLTVNDVGNELTEFPLHHYVLPVPVLGELRSRDSVSLLGEYESKKQVFRSRQVRGSANRLAIRLQRLRIHIDAELWRRAASAMVCLLTVILSAMLSMCMRSAMPLVVYFWNFIFATVAVIMTHTGESVGEELAFLPGNGLIATWFGCMLLGLTITAVYVRLTRH